MRTVSGACMGGFIRCSSPGSNADGSSHSALVVASPRQGPGQKKAASRLDDRLALLAHELGDVVGTERAFAAGAGPFPATKRLHPGPGAGGRAAAAIAIGHARFDLAEELLLLLFVVGENAGSQTIVAVVGQLGGFD